MTSGVTSNMRIHEGQSETLKPEQFQQLIEHIQATSKHPIRDCAILQVSYRCGLRAMEIAGLTLDDLLDEEGRIKEQVTLRKKTTKGKKGGTACFTHIEVREALTAFLVLKRPVLKRPVRNLFISAKLTPFSASSMCRLVSTLLTRAGYYGATNHMGRRSLAYNLNKQNVSIYNISKILRHSSIKTTEKHYMSVDKDTLAELVSGVD